LGACAVIGVERQVPPPRKAMNVRSFLQAATVSQLWSQCMISAVLGRCVNRSTEQIISSLVVQRVLRQS